MACSSGCPTPGVHASWGECIRSKNMQLNGLQSLGGDRTAQKAQDKELNLYAEAKSAGLQPKSTRIADSRRALEGVG